MLWSIGARFHLDGTAWTLSRLEFWYRGHVALYAEEQEQIERVKKEASHGRV